MANFITAGYKDNPLGEANSFTEALEQVSHLAPLDKPVLAIGERGTGKEFIANHLHYLSTYWQGPFISLNCVTFNENLLDSELFGHEADASTGAQKCHPGRSERVDGGTLLLDELTTIPMLVQEKLLRVIKYGELERVGGSQPLQVNMRLVCATNANSSRIVSEGTFRVDPLDHLIFDMVQLPPLRERQSDIMLMAEHLAIQICYEIGLPLFPGFSAEARETLLHYRWSGNIRELKSVVERSVYRHGTSDYLLDEIVTDPFCRRTTQPQAPETKPMSVGLPLNLRGFRQRQERDFLQTSLQQAKFNQKKAVELLGPTYHQLRALLRKRQIQSTFADVILVGLTHNLIGVYHDIITVQKNRYKYGSGTHWRKS